MEDRFAGKAEWFDEHYRAVRGRVRLELVLERLSGALPPPPARILDVGGGTGAFAIPLAHLGHRVTVLDQSAEWLDRARSSAAAAEVEVDLVNLSLDALADADLGSFDAILCHAVLMYVEASMEALASLRAMAAPGAVLSLLEKNRDGIALRPGLRGDYAEAHRLLTERESIRGLGVANRAYSVGEWLAILRETGWSVEDWAGVRLFSDMAPDDLDADAYAALLDLERAAGMKDPHRQVSRLVHIMARATPE
jgi:2-polyprenyl-3-methyl-5-hydroxy-6-metoxy-1,4-benzoquinol methylase